MFGAYKLAFPIVVGRIRVEGRHVGTVEVSVKNDASALLSFFALEFEKGAASLAVDHELFAIDQNGRIVVDWNPLSMGKERGGENADRLAERVLFTMGPTISEMRFEHFGRMRRFASDAFR
ncbi:hypothetical protein AU476_19185 [Cupriavidus sp. UYMSc13B]|nr:hypothetical protein AU476_19185 [Cupriavidus sp. UYMSc13B]